MTIRFLIPASALLVLGMVSLTACGGAQPTSVRTNAAVRKDIELRTNNRQMDKSQKAQQERDRIRALQQRLQDEGYYSGPVDGILTPETRSAAKRLYRDRF